MIDQMVGEAGVTGIEALEAVLGAFCSTATLGAVVLIIVLEDGVVQCDTVGVRGRVGVSHKGLEVYQRDVRVSPSIPCVGVVVDRL